MQATSVSGRRDCISPMSVVWSALLQVLLFLRVTSRARCRMARVESLEEGICQMRNE